MIRLDEKQYRAVKKMTRAACANNDCGNSVDSFSNSIRVHISALRKKLRAALGYDPIRNRIGEGYLMGGDEA